MEDLVTSTTVVELAGGAALRAPYYIDDGALDVNIASETINPGCHGSDVAVVYTCHHNKHRTRTKSQEYVH